MEMHVRYELVIVVYGCKHSVSVLISILCVVAAYSMVRYSACKRTFPGLWMSLGHSLCCSMDDTNQPQNMFIIIEKNTD